MFVYIVLLCLGLLFSGCAFSHVPTEGIYSAGHVLHQDVTGGARDCSYLFHEAAVLGRALSRGELETARVCQDFYANATRLGMEIENDRARHYKEQRRLDQASARQWDQQTRWRDQLRLQKRQEEHRRTMEKVRFFCRMHGGKSC